MKSKEFFQNFWLFTAVDTETVTNKITANINGANLPWPGLDKDGCHDLKQGGTPCPVQKGKNYSWKMDVKILPSYPKV